MSRRLSAVYAHPDDDTFGIAGVAALHGDDPGFALQVILATSGDAGKIADPSLATPETLARVREQEDLSSWRALGTQPDEIHFLRYADGEVPGVPSEELEGRVAELLGEFRPDVVVTFGPEGITGHADHMVVGRVATAAFHRLRTQERDGGFRRLLWDAVPESELAWLNERLVERGMDPIDPSQPFQPRPVPDEDVAFDVDLHSVWTRVRDALREHRTQDDASVFPEELMEQILGRAFYRQAWPPREDAGRAPSVFSGLDPS